MIGIKANDKKVHLLPDQQIRFEELNDVMNFETIEPMFAWPFDLPYEPNAETFNFPYDIDNPQDAFRDIEAETTLVGNPWKKGLLLASKVTHKRISTSFRSKSGVLAKYSDTPITNLVDETFVFSDTDPAVELPIIQAKTYSPVQFPLINVYGFEMFCNNPTYTARLGNVDTPPGQFALPTFRIINILRWIGTTIGFEIYDEISSHNNDFASTLIFDNKLLPTVISYNVGTGKYESTLPANFKVQDHLPEMTFSDLLNSIRIACCAQIDIDNEGKKITLVAMNRNLKRKNFIDFSNKLDGRITSEPVETQSFNLEFDNLDDELLSSEQPTGNYRGEFDDLTAIAAMSSPQVEDYAFSLLDNKYYKYINDVEAAENRFDPYLNPFQASDENAEKTLKSSFVPVDKSRYSYHPLFFGKKVPFVNSPNNKLASDTSYNLGTGEYDLSGDYHIIFDQLSPEGVYSNTKAHDIAGIDTNGHSIELEIAWSEDVDATNTMIRRKWDFYFPVIAGGLYGGPFFDTDRGNYSTPSRGTRIMIYHGLQEEISTSNTYPYASCDPYDSKGNKVGNEAIRFTLSDSLAKIYWSEFLRFASRTRLLKGRFFLEANTLIDFDIFKKVRIKGVDILIRKLKSVVGTGGLKKQEWEGYRVD